MMEKHANDNGIVGAANPRAAMRDNNMCFLEDTIGCLAWLEYNPVRNAFSLMVRDDYGAISNDTMRKLRDWIDERLNG